MKCLKNNAIVLLKTLTFSNIAIVYKKTSDSNYNINGGSTNTNSETKLTYTKVVTFKLPYKNTNYKVFSQVIEGGSYWALSQSNCRNRTISGFTLDLYAADHNGGRAGNVLSHSYNWRTKGYVDLEDPVVKKFKEEHQ